MKKLIIIAVILGLNVSIGSLCSQNYGTCGYIEDSIQQYTPEGGCSYNSTAWLNKYRKPSTWVPSVSTPIKTILVNYIICLKNDGTGGWVDSPEFRDEVDLMFEKINEWYSNSQQKGYSLTCEPPISHVTDTRIRFELNEIIFINNTNFHHAYGTADIFDYLEQYHPDYKKAMNHFFNMPTPNSTPYWGLYSVNPVYEQSYVLTHYSMWHNSKVVWGDHIAHIAHEYGHAVGLHHTYNGEYTEIAHYDFMDDIFGTCAEANYCNPIPPSTHICYLDNVFFEQHTSPYPLMSGMNYTDVRYISPKSAGRMHRDLSCYDKTFRIYNTPMHNYVQEDHSFSTPYKITTDETWDFAMKMYQDIEVESGNTLTVKCKVKMPIEGKIIVKPGAILIIDGGTITTAHKDVWAGIEVWGDPTDNQFEYTGHPQAQGKLILNDATIEHAKVAVRNFDYSNQATTAGGIIIANSSTFKNNKRAVSLRPYKNITSFNDVEYDYRASFTNCNFTVDSEFLGGSTYTTWQMMIWGVKGIQINGCVFENKLDNYPTGNAIYSYDAGFAISGACEVQDVSPCPSQYNNTTFNGFYRAVESANSANALYQIYIRQASFDNNGYAMHFRGVNDAVVVGNEIELGEFDDCEYDASTGIFMDNCKRFAIEDNKFTLHDPPDAITNVGIHTVNTNNMFDEIYSNEFDDMLVANYAEGKNWKYNWKTGLAYYCNENINNEWDFYVKDTGKDDDGIQENQGNSSFVAGNTFSSAASWHFDNQGDYKINYYYDQGSTPEVPSATKIYQVHRTPVVLTNTCPEHYNGDDPIKLTSTEYQQKETEYGRANSAFDILYSKYISTSDSAERVLLKAQLSHYNMLRARAAYDMLRSDLSDTLTHPSLFINIHQELGTYSSIEAIIDQLLQEGSYTSAMDKVDSLPINFSFNTYDSVEYPYYLSLKTMQANWMDAGRDIYGLTFTELTSLSAIANSSNGLAGAQARGILSFYNDSIYTYKHCAQQPDTSQKSAAMHLDKDEYIGSYGLTVLPNPARTNLTFEYNLPEKCTSGRIELYNNTGNLIEQFQLSKQNGQLDYNCSKIPTGVYYYNFVTCQSSRSGKIIINH